MHAYLIVGTNQTAINHTLNQLITKIGASRMDFTLNKIEEVRHLTNFVRLTLTQPTTIVITDIDKASLQAQNAFLKQLEEPQPNLCYLLTASNLYKLPSTVISRCRVIKLPTNLKKTASPLSNFPNLTLGQKLKTVSQIRQRDEALAFVTTLLEVYHRQPIKSVHNLELINQSYKNLKGNGNIYLQLSNLAINLCPN